ncbi:MAG: Cro/C1-type DNA-binding domain [Clostridia bacterium]|jgi:transcriptional regulator with XRE-family HTH domain|nr:Cro/C1-type DNA-binding domain [Clostridia bacterium]
MLDRYECKLKLEEVMRQKGISQRKLAKLSGVSRTYISELISGKFDNPTIFIISRLMVGLECSFEELVQINPKIDMTQYKYYPSCG